MPVWLSGAVYRVRLCIVLPCRRKLAQHQRGLYFAALPAGASAAPPAPASPLAALFAAEAHGGHQSLAQGQAAADGQLEERFMELAAGAEVAPAHVEVMMGRSLEVPAAAGAYESVRRRMNRLVARKRSTRHKRPRPHARARRRQPCCRQPRLCALHLPARGADRPRLA